MNNKKNIFVLGLDDYNLSILNRIKRQDDYEFHGLLDRKEILDGPYFDIEDLLKKARKQLNNFTGSIDAIVGYWDFPAVLLMPILRKEYGLQGPELESVLKCEHKYWSRTEQKKVIPEHIPSFSAVDPNNENEFIESGRSLHCWIKPVKAHSSILGYRINNHDDFKFSIKEIRSEIDQFSTPLNTIMDYAEIPEDIRKIHGGYCIAEDIISSQHQCTLEGYVYDDTIEIYGVVDSIRGPNQISFESYLYPSLLPQDVQEKMKTIAKNIILQIGLNYSPFNIEFFYEPATQRISLLEINARISKSHSPLFHKVDGLPNTEVMIDISLGKKPNVPVKKGQFNFAAKFMPRIYGKYPDAIITKVPDEQTIHQIKEHIPGTEIILNVDEGTRLSQLYQQDSYSYQLATIFMGAKDPESLQKQYKECLDMMDIQWRRTV